MSESFGSPLVDMLVADGAVTAETVHGQLTREQFAGDRRIRQVEERWVEGSGPYDPGHWELVEETDIGPAPA